MKMELCQNDLFCWHKQKNNKFLNWKHYKADERAFQQYLQSVMVGLYIFPIVRMYVPNFVKCTFTCALLTSAFTNRTLSIQHFLARFDTVNQSFVAAFWFCIN